MAVINHDDFMKTIQEHLAQLASQEEHMMKQLEQVRATRKSYVEVTAKLAQAITYTTQQHDLRMDALAGDKTVERDESAGNGAGGYRRVQVDHFNTKTPTALATKERRMAADGLSDHYRTPRQRVEVDAALSKLLGATFTSIEAVTGAFESLTGFPPNDQETNQLVSRVLR